MTNTISPLTAFVLSDTSAVVETTRKVLESHRFRVTTQHATAPAELCRRTRYDLAVYDEDHSAANETAASGFPRAPHVVLKLAGTNKIPHSPSTRFHFLIQKPFTGDLLAKTVRAALGLVALGRRSNFRQEVSVTGSSCCVIHQGNTSRLDRVKIVNVSYAGMCIETPGMLPQGAQIDLSFPARELGTTVNVTGTVVWAHVSGRAGIKLAKDNSLEEKAFETWLASILPGIDEFLPALPHQPRHLRPLQTPSLESVWFPKTSSQVVN